MLSVRLTAQQREELQQLRRQQHELRTAETDERRKNRLKRMRDHEHERRGAETSEQREHRLQRTDSPMSRTTCC